MKKGVVAGIVIGILALGGIGGSLTLPDRAEHYVRDAIARAALPGYDRAECDDVRISLLQRTVTISNLRLAGPGGEHRCRELTLRPTFPLMLATAVPPLRPLLLPTSGPVILGTMEAQDIAGHVIRDIAPLSLETGAAALSILDVQLDASLLDKLLNGEKFTVPDLAGRAGAARIHAASVRLRQPNLCSVEIAKLRLNDASLVFEPESSLALGFGFRCGFLGLLHLEIVQERLYREFDMDVITTVPNVSYKVYTTQHEVLDVHNPSGLPAPTLIDYIEEPYIKAQIISKSEFFGGIMKLCLDKRGTLTGQHFLSSDRVELNYEMPLAEIVFDFYDKLKSISKGYASFDYHVIGFKKADLVKLDILLNSEPVDALSSLIHREHAYDFGRKMCEKLKELIPRQQFDIAIQAAIGAKIIARETVKAVRKDVTAKCYGGDITRKRKLLEKQKKGKKRMRQVGNVEVPQSAFMAVLKLD